MKWVAGPIRTSGCPAWYKNRAFHEQAGDTGAERDKKHASGGEVSHLESGLPLRFVPRSSGQCARAFAVGCAHLQSWRLVQTVSI